MSSDRRSRLAPAFNRYAEECLTRATLLQEQLGAEIPELGTLVLHAHTLAGSGATMGADQLSADARSLEQMALTAAETGRALTPAEHQAMAALADKLVASARSFDADSMLDGFIARMFPGG